MSALSHPSPTVPPLAHPLDEGWTLPASWYSDAGVAALERERIFARTWQYGGPAEQVAAPGSFMATQAGHIPIVVTRDRAGILRGFVNVCRHRAYTIARGCGSRETLQCPYHAWTYELDGSLRKAPRSERETGFDPADFSLLPVSVDVWGPFLFVHPDPDASPLAETLGELPAIVARSGLDLSTLAFHSHHEVPIDANWKVALENYLECYHCPTAHPAFSRLIDVDPDAYVLEGDGPVWSQYGTARDGSGTCAFHLVWPALKINAYPGFDNLSVGPLWPETTGRTTGFLDYFFGTDVDDAWARDLIAFDDQVGREDTALVESVQRGVAAGLVERGRLLPESERLIASFQAKVTASLT